MINLGLIFGGKSKENEISIKSAVNIFRSLSNLKGDYRVSVKCFYIDQDGNWYNHKISKDLLNSSISGKFNDKNWYSINYCSLDNLLSDIKNIDIWFPITHGPNGEDGTIQGLLNLTNKPYIGSGVLGSAIGMDKIILKSLLKLNNLPQVEFIEVSSQDLSSKIRLSYLHEKIDKYLKYPIFIKPASLGSSIGISKVKDFSSLNSALIEASAYDKKIIVENGIDAIELEVGVIGYDNLITSEIGQVQTNSDWFDFDSKYSNNNPMIIPAKINQDLKEKINLLAIKACQIANINGLARVDFFYEKSTKNIFINEINTLPGFTEKSMFPMLWEKSGLNLDELIAKLIRMTLEKNKITS